MGFIALSVRFQIVTKVWPVCSPQLRRHPQKTTDNKDSIYHPRIFSGPFHGNTEKLKCRCLPLKYTDQDRHFHHCSRNCGLEGNDEVKFENQKYRIQSLTTFHHPVSIYSRFSLQAGIIKLVCEHWQGARMDGCIYE